MFFRKKSPSRLYLPAKTKWYTRPRPTPRKQFWVRGKKKVQLQRRLTVFKKQWFYWIFGGALLLGLSLILFFSTYLSITRIQVLRHDLNVNSAAIQEALKPHLGENLLFFDRNLAINTLQEQFVEYAVVRVKKVLPGTLKIELESHPPLFNVRAYYTLPKAEDPLSELTPPEEEEGQSLARVQKPKEAEGKIHEQKGILNAAGQMMLDQEENLELISLVVQGLRGPLENRGILMTPQRLKALRQAMERFETLFSKTIESVQYFPEGREVHLKIENGLLLWLTFEKDLVAQVEKLYSIYQSAALDQEDLAYIDLRVAEKVIYCPQDAPCDQI